MPIGQMALWASYPPGFGLGFGFELHTQILVTNAKHHKKNAPLWRGVLGSGKPLWGCANYFSKDRTLWADWLACANMAVAACEMICERARLVVSVA